MTTEKLNQMTVSTKANVYFDGKCVSHSLTAADGTQLSVGVVLASELRFSTSAAEIIKCNFFIIYLPRLSASILVY